MNKDPAFLFYPADFSVGTQFMTDEQIGKYIRLLCAQHQHGHLSQEQMIQICKTYDKTIWDKFEKLPDGKYHNKRLHEEILKRRNYCESRRDNRLSGLKSKSKQNKHMKNICLSSDEHMEDRDRDINKDEDKNKDERFKTIIDSFFKAFELKNDGKKYIPKKQDFKFLKELLEKDKTITVERFGSACDKCLNGTNYQRTNFSIWFVCNNFSQLETQKLQTFGRQEVNKNELKNQYDRFVERGK